MKKTEIKWFGWAAFQLTTEHNVKLLIDPYLECGPRKAEDFRKGDIDLILITHGAIDHTGEYIQIAKNTGALILADYAVKIQAIRNGIPAKKIHVMMPGFTFTYRDLVIRAVESVHGSFFTSMKGQPLHGIPGEDSGDILVGSPLGFVINDQKETCVYVPGDTAIGSHLQVYGLIYQPNIALIHIGAFPGASCMFTPLEAAYALQWLRSDVAIPMHYNPKRKEDRAILNEFIKHARLLAPQAKVMELKLGESLCYPISNAKRANSKK